MSSSNTDERRRWRRGCLTALIVLTVLGLVCAGGAAYVLKTQFADPRQLGADVPFNADAWKRAVRDSNVRLTMLRDLVGRVGVIGRSRPELEELLGPPTKERWSDYYPHPGYDLGFGRIDWFDGPCATPLILVYDHQGVCTGYWAYYDGVIAKGASARALGR